MGKPKQDYTMEYAIDYLKKSKVTQAILAIFFFFFAFIPPLAVLDPRIESHIAPFYLYLGIYYVLYVIFLGRLSERQKKIRNVLIEKAILLGCPLEITPTAQGRNSYLTTVLINEPMLEALKPITASQTPTQAEESTAMAEPFPHRYPIGTGVNKKFLGNNIPHFDKARKITKGDL